MIEQGHLLIADDDETFLHALAAVLEREGHVCTCAPDAATAAEELQRAACDVLIADIKMPGNTDLELIHELPQIAAGVPVILITGYPSLESAIAAIPLPVVAYLVKPPTFAQLFAAVNKAVATGCITKSWYHAAKRRCCVQY